MTAPDFDALRAERNAKHAEWVAAMQAEGWSVGHCAQRDNDACYCTCGVEGGGLCEHRWDGEPWASSDGCEWSVTCSRCGTTAMSHSLRVGP